MIHLINHANAKFYRSELDSLFRLRHELYVRRRGWSAIDRGDGTAWRPTRIVQAIGGEQVICSQADLQHLLEEYGGNRLREVGCVIYERAEVGKAQSGAALFTAPPSLLAELDRIARQHAARILAESKTGTTPSS